MTDREQTRRGARGANPVIPAGWILWCGVLVPAKWARSLSDWSLVQVPWWEGDFV